MMYYIFGVFSTLGHIFAALFVILSVAGVKRQIFTAPSGILVLILVGY